MAAVLCNGSAVLEARIVIPRQGAWTAELVVASKDASAFSGQVTIETATGGMRLVGTARPQRVGVYVDQVRLAAIGGTGGMSRKAEPKYYAGALPIRTIISDLLKTAGERLSPSTSAELMAATVDTWTTMGKPTGLVLLSLLEQAAPTASWKTSPDGTILIAEDAFPEATVSGSVATANERPQDDIIELAVSEPSLLPGTTYNGRRVSLVEQIVTARRLRTRVIQE